MRYGIWESGRGMILSICRMSKPLNEICFCLFFYRYGFLNLHFKNHTLQPFTYICTMFRTKVAEAGKQHKVLTCLLSVLLGILIIFAIASGIYFGTKPNMPGNVDNLVSGIYFSNWSVYGAKHFPQDLDTANLSHVFYAFMKIDGNSGEVSLLDPWADVDMPVGNDKGALGLFARIKQKNRNLKLIMSIGGWGTAAQFAQATGDEAKLSKFVDSTIDLVKNHRFDGIDIDWEYPTSHQEGTQLVTLLGRLRERLDQLKEGLILTMASPASEDHCRHIDFPATDRLLTYWNVMAYDFAGSGFSQKTGYHSNLYGSNGDTSLNVDDIMKFYAARVDRRKIILGMPLYGRSFNKPAAPQIGSEFSREASNGADTVNYGEIDKHAERFDSEKVAAYAYKDADDVFITYDSPQCASVKASYIKDNGFGGGFWWDSKGESKEKDRKMVGTFVEALGGSRKLNDTKNWV